MKLELVAIRKPEAVNLILGQTHFIKTDARPGVASAGTLPRCQDVIDDLSLSLPPCR